MGKLTAVNVPGKNARVTAAMIRISVLSRRVKRATLLESIAIERMTELF
jgi:hypothetical protein